MTGPPPAREGAVAALNALPIELGVCESGDMAGSDMAAEEVGGGGTRKLADAAAP